VVAGYAFLELGLVLLEDGAGVGAVGGHRGTRHGAVVAGIHGMCGLAILKECNRGV
jgi:hypothetical protein